MRPPILISFLTGSLACILFHGIISLWQSLTSENAEITSQGRPKKGKVVVCLITAFESRSADVVNLQGLTSSRIQISARPEILNLSFVSIFLMVWITPCPSLCTSEQLGLIESDMSPGLWFMDSTFSFVSDKSLPVRSQTDMAALSSG